MCTILGFWPPSWVQRAVHLLAVQLFNNSLWQWSWNNPDYLFHYIFSTFYSHLFFVNYHNQPLGCRKRQGAPFILHCQAYELIKHMNYNALSKGATDHHRSLLGTRYLWGARSLQNSVPPKVTQSLRVNGRLGPLEGPGKYLEQMNAFIYQFFIIPCNLN